MQQKQNEVKDEDRKRNRPKTSTNQADEQSIKKEYVLYITERTPWFVGDIILCITYLKNINQLASGSYDHKIRLWDLRESAKQLAHLKVEETRRSKSIKNYFGPSIKVDENLL